MSILMDVQKKDQQFYFKLNLQNVDTKSRKRFLSLLKIKQIDYYEEQMIVKYNINLTQTISLVNSKQDFTKRNGINFVYTDESIHIFEEIETLQKQFRIREEALKDMMSTNKENAINLIDEELKIELREYQKQSVRKVIEAKGGFEFSVPGAGKTIISYVAYHHLKKVDEINKLMIIGPKNAYYAWQDEYKTCFGADPDYMNLSNSSSDECKNYLSQSPSNHKEITFINYAKLRNTSDYIVDFLAKHKVFLILDEGHKVKNPAAKVTKSILKVSPYAKYRLILTGTPLPNGYEDLHTLTKIYEPNFDILPFRYQELKQLSQENGKNKEEFKIKESIHPYVSRVSKQYLIKMNELKIPNYDTKYVEMSDEQRKIYDLLKTLYGDFNSDMDFKLKLIMIKAMNIRKMQISANPALLQKSILLYYSNHYEEVLDEKDTIDIEDEKFNVEQIDLKIMSKLKKSNVWQIVNKYSRGTLITPKNMAVLPIVKETIENGEKIIIWDTFVDNMELLRNLIYEKVTQEVSVVNGNVTGMNRDLLLDDFKKGNTKVLIASPATLAESISLHKACQKAIYINRNYNAAEFIQSKDRIHRINMPENTNTNYIFMINSDSIDQSVHERLAIKEQRMLRILDSETLEVGHLESEEYINMNEEDIYDGFKY